MRSKPAPARLAGLFLTLTLPLTDQTPNPDKNADFGETRVHTSWSL